MPSVRQEELWDKPGHDVIVQLHDALDRIRRLESDYRQGIGHPTFSKVGRIRSFPFEPKHRWTAEHAYVITDLRVTAGEVCSEDAQVEVMKNGVAIATLDLPQGQHTVRNDPPNNCDDELLSKEDYLTVRWLSGAGGKDWTVQVRITRGA